MSMDPYDRKALIDVIDWHRARIGRTRDGDGYFAWMWACVPQSVIDFSTGAASRALLSVESYALDAAVLAALDEYMRSFALANGISDGDVSRLTLKHRDEIAASYCSPAAIAALLQGAGLGLGGLLFVAADIPLLVGLNCLMLAKVARVYGVSGAADSGNANVVLRLLAAGIGSIAMPVFEEEGGKLKEELQEELRARLDRIQARISQLVAGTRDECVGTDDAPPTADEGCGCDVPDATATPGASVAVPAAPEASPPVPTEPVPSTAPPMDSAVVAAAENVGRSLLEELKQDAILEVVKQLSAYLGVHFARSKMMQAVPLVGVAVGAGSNYYFTQRCTEAAIMALRHHYLRRTYPEEVLAAHEEGSGWDWQLVGGEEDPLGSVPAQTHSVVRVHAATQAAVAPEEPDVNKKMDVPVG